MKLTLYMPESRIFGYGPDSTTGVGIGSCIRRFIVGLELNYDD